MKRRRQRKRKEEGKGEEKGGGERKRKATRNKRRTQQDDEQEHGQGRSSRGQENKDRPHRIFAPAHAIVLTSARFGQRHWHAVAAGDVAQVASLLLVSSSSLQRHV